MAGRMGGEQSGTSGQKRGLRVWRDAADDGLRAAVGKGRKTPEAHRVSRLLPGAGDPDKSVDGDLKEAVRARLERALRAERRRGLARHWTYDFNRHVALLQALAAIDAEADSRRRPEPESKAPPA